MALKVLQILPGPCMNINNSYYQMLSPHFTGTIITTSGNPDIINLKQIGSFDWKCFRFNHKKQFLSRVLFFCNSLKFSIKQRIHSGKYDLVVTYDPLITGLQGLICSIILNSKFSPEVNGVYTSKIVFADGPQNIKTKLSRFLFPILEKFVLQQGHGIKLLFPTQIDPLHIKIHKKTIRSFPCFVDIDLFTNFHTPAENSEILFIGYPFKLKGVDVLIKAFKKISDRYPEWKLKILGWFPDTAELYSAINNHPQISHHPPVHYPDIPKHICTCGIFVLPSRSEAMGRVLVEAMAAGKPRIGSNIEGIPTVINDGIDGLLFSSENDTELAQKLELLINNRELRKNLGDAGKVRAQQEFNKDIYCSNLLNFYNDIIHTKM